MLRRAILHSIRLKFRQEMQRKVSLLSPYRTRRDERGADSGANMASAEQSVSSGVLQFATSKNLN